MKIFITILFLGAAVSLEAGYTHTVLSINGAGGRMSGETYTSIGSFSPAGGYGMRSARFHNHSGFASGFILQPETALNILPDEWNPDNDLDGMSDYDEIIAGTCPNDPDSVLTVSAEILSDGHRRLSLLGAEGRIYTFEYRDSLSGEDWTPFPAEIQGEGADILFFDTQTVSQRFYRIKVRRSH